MEDYDPKAKYMLRYHDPEKGSTEMKQFRGFFGMARFLLGTARPALLSGRYQVLTIGEGA